MLEPVRLNDVLPSGKGRLPQRNMQRPQVVSGKGRTPGHQKSHQQINALIRKPAPARTTLRGPLLCNKCAFHCQRRLRSALIAMLVLKWLHYLSKANWSFSNHASMLRLNLFTYRDLMEWLHNPFNTEPIVPQPEQLQLPLKGLGQPRPPKRGTST